MCLCAITSTESSPRGHRKWSFAEAAPLGRQKSGKKVAAADEKICFTHTAILKVVLPFRCSSSPALVRLWARNGTTDFGFAIKPGEAIERKHRQLGGRSWNEASKWAKRVTEANRNTQSTGVTRFFPVFSFSLLSSSSSFVGTAGIIWPRAPGAAKYTAKERIHYHCLERNNGRTAEQVP